MDQLAEIRALQQQRFQAQRAQQEQDSTKERQAHSAAPIQPASGYSQAPRPAALELPVQQAEDTSAARCSSCPGTPRAYRERQQQRFEVERMRRKQEQDGADASVSDSTSTPPSMSRSAPRLGLQTADAVSRLSLQTEHIFPRLSLQTDHIVPRLNLQSPVPDAEELEGSASGASSSETSPSMSTPRMRGSASLRAISAARAMRTAEAVPLPGAAWPGHSQKQAKPASHALPPRPTTPSNLGKPTKRRSSSRSAIGLPPRPPTPSSSQGYMRERSLSSCASEHAGSNERPLMLGTMCY